MQYLRPDSIRQWTDGDYLVSTDPERVDIDVVQRFIVEDSYWATNRCITDDLAGVRRVVLGTRDANGLCAPFGFRPVEHPELWMQRMRPTD